jgi:hypothetical protein
MAADLEPFHSEAQDGPFQACTRCDADLLTLRTGYQIVKCWHRHEVVYEYALCQACQAALVASFSEESRVRLSEYHQQHLRAGFGPTRCATCSKDAAAITSGEYSLTGLFLGPQLDQQVLVCGDCTREMQSLFSTHTRRVWDAFLAENFPAPPSDVVVPDPVCA